MRILITGWSGYIGAVMARVLESQGHEVTGLDAGYHDKCFMGDVKCPPPKLRKDIRDLVPNDLKGYEAVVHLAALSNDTMGKLHPEWTYQINIEGSLRLARLAQEAGVKRFLFSSSCGIYGVSKDGHATENSTLQPLTEYATSKVRTEEGLNKLADDNFSPVYLRNATAYGISARMRLDLVLNNLTAWAFATGTAKVLGDGTPWRPMVHVEDIARAFAAVLKAPRSLIHNQAFNVGVSGENYQVKDLAEMVTKVVPGAVIAYEGARENNPADYRVVFDKISRTIPAFQPAWNVRKGIDQMYAAFLSEWIVPGDLESRNYIRLKQLRYLLETGELDGNLQFNQMVIA